MIYRCARIIRRFIDITTYSVFVSLKYVFSSRISVRTNHSSSARKSEVIELREHKSCVFISYILFVLCFFFWSLTYTVPNQIYDYVRHESLALEHTNTVHCGEQ